MHYVQSLPPLPTRSTRSAQKEGKNNEKFPDLRRILLPKILPIKIPGGGVTPITAALPLWQRQGWNQHNSAYSLMATNHGS